MHFLKDSTAIWNTHMQALFMSGSFRTWIRQLRRNPGIEPVFLPLVFFTTFARLATAPVRALDRFVFPHLPADPAPRLPPVFIIGHWRSGTTHLHNLMCQDPQMGFLSLLQALSPEMMLFHRWVKRGISEKVRKRPMDNMPMAPNLPQEDEFALMNMTDASFYHAWMFPRKARFYFDTYALLENLSQESRCRWANAYAELVRKLSMVNDGRRLVLKNPVNTGRIKHLLYIFPDAKFIHMVRNPYQVFPSTVHLHKKMHEIAQLQTISDKEITDNVLLFYKKLMEKYLAEKEMIPDGQFTEIRFEDLEAAPLTELEKIYTALNISGFPQAESRFMDYMAIHSGYRKNTYALNASEAEQVSRQWGSFIDHWGYNRP